MMPPGARPLAALLCLLFLLAPASAAPSAHPGTQSAETVGHAGRPSVLLMEVSTGQVLEAEDPTRRFPPASLGKLMTLYLTLEAIRAGRLTFETRLTVSVEAWRIARIPGSSRMFLNAGDVVTVSQLLEGLMVASGNDAGQALAEAVAGSSEQFVHKMNAEAARLGMRDTHFVTPHGLPARDEYTTAWDVALLSRRILLDYPAVTQYSSPQYETYAGIRQPNWNNLVFRDPRVDGLKTGHTAEAGFSIAATARQGAMRLLAVVMGAPTLKLRTALAEKLLNAGFAGYVLAPVPWYKIVPAAMRVYGGTTDRLLLEAAHPLQVLLARDAHPALTVSEEITLRPFAPVQRGQQVGLLSVRREASVLATAPLIAGATIQRGGVLTRAWGLLQYAMRALVHRQRSTWSGTYTPRD